MGITRTNPVVGFLLGQPVHGIQQQPPVAVDPRTGQEYLLIRREVYEGVRGLLRPLGRGWDNPADDDLIRRDGGTAARSSK